jgi:hypothetical protein
VATHRVPILGWSVLPDSTGEASFEPADVNFGTNDLARQFLLGLGSALAAQPTVKHGVYGSFVVPKNYVGTAKISIHWSATLTTGDVVFDFDYNAVGGNDAESYDPAAWQESVTVTDTAPGTARRKLATEVNLTSANLAADDIVQFFFGRDGVAGGDTMAGRAYVIDVLLEYVDA